MKSLLKHLLIAIVILLIGKVILGFFGLEWMVRTKINLSYIPQVELKKDCWVRALKFLEKIEKDPNIFDPRMCFGNITFENTSIVAVNNHAWIKYIKRTKGGWLSVTYDPTSDRYAISNLINMDKPPKKMFKKKVYKNWKP